MNRYTRLAVTLCTPVFVLLFTWTGGMLAQRFAPGAMTVVAVVGLLLWVASIYVVARGLHRALWQRDDGGVRQTEAGPWGKLLLTALLTVLWFGLLAQVLALAFPVLFRRPQ
jgi:hypothetical protein